MATHNQDLKEVDRLVAEYKTFQTLENPTRNQKIQRNKILTDLLEHFKDYMNKYVGLLRGGELNLRNKDTYQFLSLFLAGKPKDARSLMSARAQISRVMQYYEEDDIFNELVIIFVNILDRYVPVVDEEGNMVNFVYYFTMVFRFRVKDWFNKLVTQPLLTDTISLDEEYEDEEGHVLPAKNSYMVQRAIETFLEEVEEVEKKLDFSGFEISWVINSDNPLFKGLTRYDRYLLYCHFGMNMSVQAIADALGRDKDTIWRHLSKILEHLRECTKENGRKEGEERERGEDRLQGPCLEA